MGHEPGKGQGSGRGQEHGKGQLNRGMGGAVA